MKTRISVILALLLAFAGCTSEQETEQKSADEEQAADETVFDPMLQTMDRARQVEDLAAQRRDNIDEAIENADGGKDDDDDQ